MSAPTAFRTRIAVRFGDVDHAGIVYYPRYFIYFHEAFEDFFNLEGPRYATLLDQRRIGFPTVHIDADYQAPLRYGDSLDVALTVSKIGRSSAVFRYEGHRVSDGKLTVSARITTVCTHLDRFESLPFPDDVRALYERFAEPQPA